MARSKLISLAVLQWVPLTTLYFIYDTWDFWCKMQEPPYDVGGLKCNQPMLIKSRLLLIHQLYPKQKQTHNRIDVKLYIR